MNSGRGEWLGAILCMRSAPKMHKLVTYLVIKRFVHNYVLSSFVSIATRLYFDFPYKLVHLVVFVF